MAARQPMLPPFGVGIQHKIFNTINPASVLVATYVGPTPHVAGSHRFQVVPGQIVAGGTLLNIDTSNPLYGIQGSFVGYIGNAGGRRKSRRSKRSKRSTRKSRRRY
jgi:hypothetical protein